MIWHYIVAHNEHEKNSELDPLPLGHFRSQCQEKKSKFLKNSQCMICGTTLIPIQKYLINSWETFWDISSPLGPIEDKGERRNSTGGGF